MKTDRRAIMLDARRRYLSRQRPGEIALPWAECLRRAWAAWRHRRDQIYAIDARMDEIAAGVRQFYPPPVVAPAPIRINGIAV